MRQLHGWAPILSNKLINLIPIANSIILSTISGLVSPPYCHKKLLILSVVSVYGVYIHIAVDLNMIDHVSVFPYLKL